MTVTDREASESGLPRASLVTRHWVRAGLGALFLSSVAWVIATRRIPDSADQAVVGLMGIHILEGRGHPVFYFGATYGGSFEAHLVAAAFALFGASTATYRGVLALLAVAVVLSVWAVARACGDRASARWAAAYLALPPFFFLYKVLTSDGHYASACLVASGIVGAALWYRARSEGGGALVSPAAALGLAGGLGLWITPLFFPVFAATATWLGAVEGRRLRLRPLLALAAAFVAGSFPWWFWNARHGWASLAAPEAGARGAPPGLPERRAPVHDGPAHSPRRGPTEHSAPGPRPPDRCSASCGSGPRARAPAGDPRPRADRPPPVGPRRRVGGGGPARTVRPARAEVPRHGLRRVRSAVRGRRLRAPRRPAARTRAGRGSRRGLRRAARPGARFRATAARRRNRAPAR